MQISIDINIKMIVIYSDLAKKFGLQVRHIKVDIQKIDSFKLDNFGIVIAFLSINNRERRSYFSKKTFLLVNLSIDIALRIIFFILSNIVICFIDENLQQKTYIAAKIFLIIRQIKLIRKKNLQLQLLIQKMGLF